MKTLLKATGAIAALAVGIVSAAYLADVHQCKRLNYEETGQVVTTTFLISMKHCFDVAGGTKLRGYARPIEDQKSSTE